MNFCHVLSQNIMLSDWRLPLATSSQNLYQTKSISVLGICLKTHKIRSANQEQYISIFYNREFKISTLISGLFADSTTSQIHTWLNNESPTKRLMRCSRTACIQGKFWSHRSMLHQGLKRLVSDIPGLWQSRTRCPLPPTLSPQFRLPSS